MVKLFLDNCNILTQGTGLLWLPGGIKLFAVFYTFGNIAALARYVQKFGSSKYFICCHSPNTPFP